MLRREFGFSPGEGGGGNRPNYLRPGRFILIGFVTLNLSHIIQVSTTVSTGNKSTEEESVS